MPVMTAERELELAEAIERALRSISESLAIIADTMQNGVLHVEED